MKHHAPYNLMVRRDQTVDMIKGGLLMVSLIMIVGGFFIMGTDVSEVFKEPTVACADTSRGLSCRFL